MSAAWVATATAAAVFVLTGCGTPADQPTGGDPAGPGATSPAATTGPTAVAANAGVTPEQVCALVSTADMARITGFTISSTKAERSGDVSVCHYVGSVDGFESSKVITEYQPTGKGAMEYTKSKGVAVADLGQDAVWFSTGAQLLVQVGGDAVFGVYVQDVRMHAGDPRTGARQIADIAVPQLMRS
ncbi:MAG TPA: DUF3558 family protein [Micromonosporaceae bacterium]